MSTYFNDDSPMLFDWGMTIIRTSMAISDHFSFNLEMVFRSGFLGDPKLEFTLGWLARW